ncbi:hypothetical protein CBW56_02455 [Denitratisoma oestradiolicum]|nr:hypothetical protein CBW56_02455 [Denitratisoma oestradiolicum]
MLGVFSDLPQVVDGIRFSLSSGAPANGDVFLVRPDAPPMDRVISFATNTGSATLASTGSNIQTMTASDYRLTLTGVNSFTLERISDHQFWKGVGSDQAEALVDLMTNAAPQGFDLELSGAMQINDSFLVRPTRHGARDIALATTDPRDIALAAPIRTSAGLSNAGTAAISAGVVDDTSVRQAAPFSVVYEAASNSLVGFPVGSLVQVGAIRYPITTATTRVPYAPGLSININGLAATITGIPQDGDVFTFSPNITPPIAPPGVGNTGFATLFGMPSPSTLAGPQGVATAGVTLPASFTVAAGNNDQFNIALDGGAAVTATILPGTYTPATLLTAVQTALNTALGAAPPAAGSATVSLNSSNQLVVISTTVGAGSAVALSSASNLGTGLMVSALALTNSSLPAAPITLTYRQATTVPVLPDRLVGFPVGSMVTVTPSGGRPTTYTIGQTTDYVPYTSGSELAFNGLRFSISGPAVEGDLFTVGPNPSGVSDNRNAGLLGALQTSNAMTDGTATFQAAYSQVVSQVGNKSREVEVTMTAQQNLAKQGQDAIQSQSGVNLDEEAANLLRFQQAYQAAAKIINVSSKLFDELLSLGR